MRVCETLGLCAVSAPLPLPLLSCWPCGFGRLGIVDQSSYVHGSGLPQGGPFTAVPVSQDTLARGKEEELELDSCKDARFFKVRFVRGAA